MDLRQRWARSLASWARARTEKPGVCEASSVATDEYAQTPGFSVKALAAEAKARG